LIRIHETIGLIIVLLSILLLIWNALRILSKWDKPSFRSVLVGLLDLQVLLGIITFAIHPIWGKFLLHPIVMIIAAGSAHVILKETRPVKVQLTGYVITVVLLLVGVSAGR
jgi:hypothetical protein